MAHRVTEIRIALHRRDNRRDPERMIRYLERDEYRFRSGYVKEAIWRRLNAAELSGLNRRRLLEVAMRYLQKRMNREFWYMCRFISRIADDEFRARVAKLAESRDELIRKRASLLLPYFQSSEAGEAAREKFRHECWSRQRYVWRPLGSYQSQGVMSDGKQESFQVDRR